MKIRKPPVTITCVCGNMVITPSPHRVTVKGGWIKVHQHAVCTECQDRVRIAPEIVLLDHNGKVIHVLQS